MIIVGFDPGGINQFGWCLTETSKEGRLKVLDCGLESHAAGAVDTILKHIPARSEIMAVGIDSPLYWNPSGSRNADKLIRRAMRQRGASNVSGTVQEVNSLRGACLSQGIMTAHHLMRQHKPNVRITESHPKALLWLLGYASPARKVRNISIADLGDRVIGMSRETSDHERDAVLGAITANAMVTGQEDWRELRNDERDAFEPVSEVEYWMPISHEEA